MVLAGHHAVSVSDSSEMSATTSAISEARLHVVGGDCVGRKVISNSYRASFNLTHGCTAAMGVTGLVALSSPVHWVSLSGKPELTARVYGQWV